MDEIERDILWSISNSLMRIADCLESQARNRMIDAALEEDKERTDNREAYFEAVRMARQTRQEDGLR